MNVNLGVPRAIGQGPLPSCDTAGRDGLNDSTPRDVAGSLLCLLELPLMCLGQRLLNPRDLWEIPPGKDVCLNSKMVM